MKNIFVVIALYLFLLACKEREENINLSDVEFFDDISDLSIYDTGFKTPIETAVCGLKRYDWLDPSTTGKVLKIEELPEYSLSREAIKSLLSQYQESKFIEIKYDVKVYRFRYTTQNKGEIVEATSMFGVPVTEDETPIDLSAVLWLHGTSGFMDDCAPGRTSDGAYSMVLMATQGFMAVGPDYLGLNSFGAASTVKHPYLGMEATAIASLDALKATQILIKRLKLPLNFNKNVILWGGSQGGHAVFSVDLFAPYYAPEFNYIAAVALIPPTNLVDAAVEAVKRMGDDTVTLAAVMIELSRWYEMFQKMYEIIRNDEPLKPLDTLTNIMDTRCGVGDQQFEIKAPEDLYLKEFIESITKKEWEGFEDIKCILKENSPDFTFIIRKSSTPFLYVLSEKDELVNTPVQRISFDRLCQKGYEMEYLECKDASHTQGAAWSVKEQFEWVRKRLKGEKLIESCKIKEPTLCSGTRN